MASDGLRDFARKAEEARDAAAKTDDTIARNQWLQVAEMWELLAEEHRKLRKLTENILHR